MAPNPTHSYYPMDRLFRLKPEYKDDKIWILNKSLHSPMGCDCYIHVARSIIRTHQPPTELVPAFQWKPYVDSPSPLSIENCHSTCYVNPHIRLLVRKHPLAIDEFYGTVSIVVSHSPNTHYCATPEEAQQAAVDLYIEYYIKNYKSQPIPNNMSESQAPEKPFPFNMVGEKAEALCGGNVQLFDVMEVYESPYGADVLPPMCRLKNENAIINIASSMVWFITDKPIDRKIESYAKVHLNKPSAVSTKYQWTKVQKGTFQDAIEIVDLPNGNKLMVCENSPGCGYRGKYYIAARKYTFADCIKESKITVTAAKISIENIYEQHQIEWAKREQQAQAESDKAEIKPPKLQYEWLEDVCGDGSTESFPEIGVRLLVLPFSDTSQWLLFITNKEGETVAGNKPLATRLEAQLACEEYYCANILNSPKAAPKADDEPNLSELFSQVIMGILDPPLAVASYTHFANYIQLEESQIRNIVNWNEISVGVWEFKFNEIISLGIKALPSSGEYWVYIQLDKAVTRHIAYTPNLNEANEKAIEWLEKLLQYDPSANEPKISPATIWNNPKFWERMPFTNDYIPL